jgi:hypothetical protein
MKRRHSSRVAADVRRLRSFRFAMIEVSLLTSAATNYKS